MRDGWRHLRLMLVYSPTALFIVPGLVMMVLGALLTLTVYGHLSISGRAFYAHTLIGGSLLIIVGTQVVGLGLCGRAYGHFQLGVRDPLFEKWDGRIRLEHGLLLGAVGVVLGLIFGAVIVGTWVQRGFGTLAEERLAILAATAIVAGIQVFFTSFLLSPAARADQAEQERREEHLDAGDDRRRRQDREPLLGERAEAALHPRADDHCAEDQTQDDATAPSSSPCSRRIRPSHFSNSGSRSPSWKWP